jgi:DNA-binding CsgD family transcriptional regulator
MEDAWSFIDHTQEKIKQICQPLKMLGLEFGYEKIFQDGSFFVLTSHNTVFHKTFRDYNRSDYSGNDTSTKYYIAEMFASVGSHHKSLLWPIELYSPNIQKIYYKHNIMGGLTFFRKQTDYVESWYFVSDNPPPEAAAFLLHHSKALEQFICYFNHHAKDLQNVTFHNLALPQLHKELITWGSAVNEENMKVFLDEIQIKHYDLTLSPDKMITLSKREVECLYHLSLGKSAKEIALTLKISPRTVESHIAHIKDKTNLPLRSQLIKKFLESYIAVPT